MPLPEGLLNPIPGDNPSGKNIRYDPVYDKIREARREEENIQQGEWSYQLKKADYPLVVKLATDVLANKSKDLQIAVWLTEAMLNREHIAGLRESLDLLKGLLENFWASLYPEIEDDDVEIRAAPLGWVGSKLDLAVRRLPLTKSKLDLLKYQESVRIGYEKDCEGNENRTAARATAIAEKKCTAEEFDDAVKETGAAYYEKLAGNLAPCLESLQALEALCDEKFGRDAPNFGALRTAVEEMQDMVKHFHKPAVQEEEAPVEEQVEEAQAESAGAAGGGAAAVVKKRSLTSEPVDRDDAMQRLTVVAGFLRKESPQNPVPYLLLRAARWGELRGAGSSLDPTILEAPPTEKRTHIKKMALEGNWSEVLEGAESVMNLPSGRGWLDLQRYAVRACESLGYEPVAAAIRSDLKALLADYPDLVNASLMDDTPAANAETLVWLKENILPPPPPEPVATPAPEPEPLPVAVVAPPPNANGEKPPDVVELAMKAARAGKVQEAIGMLTRDISNERTGRGRFQKHIQLANIFLATKHESIAYPILVELAEEIDRRKLEEWEDPALVAQPLALLYRCSEKLGRGDAEKDKIYQKLCRLDPAQALALR